MDGSIRRSATDRKILFEVYRRGIDPEQRLRPHILLMLGDGVAWGISVKVLYTSTATINAWRGSYLDER